MIQEGRLPMSDKDADKLALLESKAAAFDWLADRPWLRLVGDHETGFAVIHVDTKRTCGSAFTALEAVKAAKEGK